MLWALLMEGLETSRMVHVYARHGTGKLRIIPKHKKPTPEELHEASEQLKDIPRFLPFFVVVAVPVPGVTEGYTLVAITLEKWLGHKFRLLPSQFREILEPVAPQEDPKPESDDLEGKPTLDKKHLPDV
jgi:hypothetical protein